jgi:hypothetical protein
VTAGADPGFFAGRGPTPKNEVVSSEILKEVLGLKYFRKRAIAVKIPVGKIMGITPASSSQIVIF